MSGCDISVIGSHRTKNTALTNKFITPPDSIDCAFILSAYLTPEKCNVNNIVLIGADVTLDGVQPTVIHRNS